ncbi:hypothetical protein ATCC90586_010409 [Pythium insidiosum]|nr:hypothetical protein ATCC90586_010409 [Pythium insidiosum]
MASIAYWQSQCEIQSAANARLAAENGRLSHELREQYLRLDRLRQLSVQEMYGFDTADVEAAAATAAARRPTEGTETAHTGGIDYKKESAEPVASVDFFLGDSDDDDIDIDNEKGNRNVNAIDSSNDDDDYDDESARVCAYIHAIASGDEVDSPPFQPVRGLYAVL